MRSSLAIAVAVALAAFAGGAAAGAALVPRPASPATVQDVVATDGAVLASRTVWIVRTPSSGVAATTAPVAHVVPFGRLLPPRR